ncbi:hypothetical protein KC19_9G160700 [Ceratodon purpureus]|uniref:Uncharacterized protein n=1 Tax=Ceratodon purpureus TaxID=3225 RepID=A0A8T0GSI2_CERPU|nr:hypothetical protein KC19_9G160700 [Ceratodon purpureus]
MAAAAVRWASLGPMQCARAGGSVVVSGAVGRRKCGWASRRLGRQRGSLSRVGVFDDSGPELVMNGNGSARVNEIGTLALVFPDAHGDDDGSGQGSMFDLPREDDECNELYEKLAVNSRSDDDPAGDGVENEVDSEQEFEQAHVEGWKEQIESRIGGSAFQHASQLLEAVTRTLDGLEDGLVKHAEELEASALSEGYNFSGVEWNVAEGSGQTSDDASSQPLEMKQMREEIAVRDVFLEMLQEEAIEASETLKTATHAMLAAKGKIKSLQEQLDTTTGFLQQEKEATQQALNLFSSSLLALSGAELRVRELEKQVEISMQTSKFQEISTEVESLKVLLDTKEKAIQAMLDENRHNTNTLLAAAKTQESLANAEKKIQLLMVQVATLEEQVSSRDELLSEVKDEMIRSTDALKYASQVKQELNASKQKELGAIQELEVQKELVKELQQELAENQRAVLAEQALQQMEKAIKDLKFEVETLREGVGARDDALSLMREEVDRSVVFLANAAENREAVRELTTYVEELREELAKKDETIVSLRKELAQTKSSLQQGNSNARFMASTDPAQPTKPTSTPAEEETKLKGKPTWRRQDSSPRRSSRSRE